MDNEEIKDLVIDWSIRFPIDKWFRKKYNIPYNSKSHRDSNFLDQLFEYEEDKLFESFNSGEQYIPGAGDWIKSKEPASLSEAIAQLKEEFKDLK